MQDPPTASIPSYIIYLVVFLETTASDKPSLKEGGWNGPSRCPCTPRQKLAARAEACCSYSILPHCILSLQPQSKVSAIVRHTVIPQSSSNSGRVIMYTINTRKSAEMRCYIDDGLPVSAPSLSSQATQHFHKTTQLSSNTIIAFTYSIKYLH